jgi:high-affinity Fe2+/Pb2+ permease
MNKTAWMGIVLAIYGIIVLIGAAMACPCKHASISVSLFMLLTGIAFFFLGKDIEKAKEAK